MNIDSLIEQFVKDYKNVPFEWDKNDCMSFIADWTLRFTGKDYRSRFPHGYSTEKGAMKAIIKSGFNSPEDLLDSLFKRQNKRKSKRGNIVGYHFYKNFMSVGVNLVEESIFLHTNGIITVPSKQIEYHWELT